MILPIPMLFNRTIGQKRLITFLRNLSVTLKAGIPLVSSIRLMETDARHDGFIRYLRGSVEKGMTLAAAMEFSPWTFPPLVVSVVQAGELSGTLQENLHIIASQMQKILDFRRKIKSAMLYPSFVLLALAGVGLCLGMFVLPQLIPLFESLDVSLPLTTRLMLKAAVFFRDDGLIFTPSFAAGCVLLLIVLRMKAVKPLRDRFLLSVPFIGSIQRNASITQTCGTLALLLQSGIPIAEAIPTSAQAAGNEVFRTVVAGAAPAIREGNTFASALRKHPSLFPAMTLQLIEIGEAAGSLSTTLSYVAEFHEEEADYAVKTFTTALEPALLIFSGVLVGIFVLSVIIPIYDVTATSV